MKNNSMPTIKETFKTALLPLKGKRNLLNLLYVSFFASLLSFVFNFVFKLISDMTLVNQGSVYYLILSIFLFLLFIFLWSFLYNFLYKFSFQLIFYSSASWKELIKISFKTTPRFLLVSFLFILKIIAGTILLVVPALIWGVKNFFTPIIASVENEGVKNAFGKSTMYSRGVFWGLLLRIIIFSLVYSIPGFIINRYIPDYIFIQSFFLPITALFYVALYKGAREKQTPKKMDINSDYTSDMNKYTV